MFSGNLTLSLFAVSVSRSYTALSHLRLISTRVLTAYYGCVLTLTGDILERWGRLGGVKRGLRDVQSRSSWFAGRLKQRKTMFYASEW